LEKETIEADVQSALDLILRECVRRGREFVPRSHVLGQMASDFTPRSNLTWSETITALESEGVLASDRSYVAGAVVDVIRIAFQAFADYLILRQRLRGIRRKEPLKERSFLGWLSNASYGILEAAAVVLPELYSTELCDYLDTVEWKRKRQPGWCEDIVVQNLP
jgi:hypothetical protein